MTENKIDTFNEIAIALFKPLVENYGYILNEIKITGEKWSSHHIYINSKKKLQIIIKKILKNY